MYHLLTKKARKHVEERIGEVEAKIDAITKERDENSRGREGYFYFESADGVPSDHREEWLRFNAVHKCCEGKLKKLYFELGGLHLEQKQFDRLDWSFWVGIITSGPILPSLR